MSGPLDAIGSPRRSGALATNRLAVLLLALAPTLGLGCSCDEPPEAAPLPEPEPARPVVSEPTSEIALPEASGGAELVPTISIEAGPRGYRVSNRALVETWPPPDRDRVVASAPPDHPTFPIVEVDVPMLDDGAPLSVPGVRDALVRALEAERARSGSGAPIVFSLRAPATLGWARVARALFTAALAGLSEPWIVVHTPSGERTLRLPRPSTATSAAATLDLGAALRGLGTTAPEAPPSEATSPSAPPLPVLGFALEEHGLRVRRGIVELGAGCHAPASDGSPAIPLAALADGHTLVDCLASLGEGTLRFEAQSDVAFGTAVTVLAALAGRGPVDIAIAAN